MYKTTHEKLQIPIPTIGTALMLICFSLVISVSSFSQELARGYREKLPNQEDNLYQGKNGARPLELVLSELEAKYNVSFSFNVNLIKDKFVTTKDMKENELEKTLASLLKPLGLQFKKIESNYYVIQAVEKSMKEVKRRAGFIEEYSSPNGGSENGSSNLAKVNSLNTLLKAKDIEIKGRVTSQEDGQPIPGANIILKGTSIGTTSNVDGVFTIKVPDENATLVVSFIGYTPEEVALNGRKVIDVSLVSDIQQLSEVVVVGYGTQKRVNLTGAISTVDSERIARRQVGQSSMVLQGVAPGVVVTQRNGQPGRDVGTVSIRGKTTLGNNNPLVLVDGVEMGIDNIDPSLIESISVLKDAASSSIYGSRAANGVILVTTKRAKKDQFSVSYNTYAGWQKATDIPDMVGAIDHMNMINEAYVNVGKSPLYSEEFIQEYQQGTLTDPHRYPDTDWYKEVLTGSGFMQSHFLTLNAGSEKIRVLGSFGYLNQDGIIENTNFKRYTLRLNTDMDISKKLSAQVDGHIKLGKTTEPSRDANSAIHWAGRIPATQDFRLSNGLWGEGWNGDNPVAFTRDGGLKKFQDPSVTLNMGLKYRPVKDVTVDLVYAPNYWESHQSDFDKVVQTYKWDGTASYASPQKSVLNTRTDRSLINNLRGTVTIDKSFLTHNLKFLAGYQQEDFRYDGLKASREGFAFPDYPVLNSGGEENQKTYGWTYEWAIRSYFGRVNYDFKEKYLFEANVRYDGSSRFIGEKRWGAFPSFSAGWRVSQEPFFSSLSNTINNLKIRASWGKLGNQDIGNQDIGYYPFSSDVNLTDLKYVFNKAVVNGAGITKLANTDVAWETTTSTNLGLDVTLLRRISIVAEYYYKVTNDILLALDIPLTIGMAKPEQNAGKVENRGWDLGINYTNWENAFKYEIGFNLSDVKNKVLDLKGVKNSSNILVNHEGYPMFSMYGLKAIGFITEEDFDESGNYKFAKQSGNIAPGDIKYQDINNDTLINSSDYTIFGNTIPRFTYGLNFHAEYKGFDFALFIQGVGKADGLITDWGIMPFKEGGTVQEQHKDRWTPDNRDATFPRFAFNETNNLLVSSFWMRNAAYARLKNIQLGYSLPASLLESARIQQVRFYVSGQNLFTIDDFWDGYDVEAPVGNGGYYPQVKTYSIGLDLRF